MTYTLADYMANGYNVSPLIWLAVCNNLITVCYYLTNVYENGPHRILNFAVNI